MYKLLFLTLMIAVWVMLQALQTDEEMAMQTLFTAKHAVNRAVHAAAQQLDADALAHGSIRIDEAASELEGIAYLQANLRLDGTGKPIAGSFLRERVEILVFDVINSDHTFPYVYRNDSFHYEVTLARPGVVMVVRLQYPRASTVIDPITWEIKGAAELVIQS